MGRDALAIVWDDVKDKVDSVQQFTAYRELAKTKGTVVSEKGNAEKALSNMPGILEAELLPYLAHATMEPLNCSVKISNGSCEIWTGTQTPALNRRLRQGY